MSERKGLAGVQEPLHATPREATIANADDSIIRECQELETTQTGARDSEVHQRARHDEPADQVAALQRERMLANDIFEAAPEAYVLTDASGRIMRANQRVLQLLCIDPCFLRHKPLIGYVAREDRARFLQLIIKTAADREPSRHVVRLRPRGSSASVACLASVSRAASKESDHVLRWIFCELPSRTPSDAHESASSTSHETAHLLAEVSQELRTQLSSVSGWLQIIRQNLPEREAGLRALASITRAVRSTIGVAERIADYARLEREDAPLDCTRIALPELVGQLVDEMRVIAVQRGFRLSALLRGGVPAIVGDPRQLRLALRRVVWDLARSTAPGGELYIAVALSGSHAMLTIRSTGCGIDRRSEVDLHARALDSDIGRAHRCLKLHGATIDTELSGADGHSKTGISFPVVKLNV